MKDHTKEDKDFFVAHPLASPVRYDDVRENLRPLVEQALSEVREPRDLEDLYGTLRYLQDTTLHDSEGRDLSFDKRSFSRTELGVAARHRPEDRVPYLLYRYRFDHYPRAKKLSPFPIILAVEPTSICNLRCVMCWQADHAFTSDRSHLGVMDFGLYQRIVDEGQRAGLRGIVLASRGEPTLHPKIVEMVRYAKERGVLDVKLNTNATKMGEKMSRGLLEAGLDTLVFSVDSPDPAEFEKIRPPAKFAEVVHNIRLFHRIRSEEYPQAPTRTRVTMVRLQEEQNPDRAQEFWSKEVDEFGYRWVIDRLHIYGLGPSERTRACSLLWERLYLWYDGTVNPCDEDYMSHLSPGRLDQLGSIEAAWKSPGLDRYRKLHLLGCKNQLHPCDRCHGF